MNIPEKVALEGTVSINEYKVKRIEEEQIRSELYDIQREIQEVQSDLIELGEKWDGLRVSYYYEYWKTRSVMKTHLKFRSLVNKHEELAYKFIDLDNRNVSIKYELYERGWLNEWEKKELEKIDRLK